jgi:hypothetical protein
VTAREPAAPPKAPAVTVSVTLTVAEAAALAHSVVVVTSTSHWREAERAIAKTQAAIVGRLGDRA